MKYIYLTVLLMIIGSYSLFSQSVLTSEEYAVQNAVLEEVYTSFLDKYKTKVSFIILEDTVPLDFVPGKTLGPAEYKDTVSNYSLTKLPSHLDDLGKDFRNTNKVPAIIKRQESRIFEYSVISDNELNSIFEEGKKQTAECRKNSQPCGFGYEAGWQLLRKKYPNSNGYYRFSRAGFSTDRKTALLFFAIEGSGYERSSFYVLEKKEGNWQVVNKLFGTSSGS